jgi:23S rRNA (pseudouridine1915-N3)-methyltransferase
MKFHLIAVSQRVPDWIEQGYYEFAKRLPVEHRINLIEIAASKRHKNSDARRLLEREAQQMTAAIPKSAIVIALDVSGQQLSTQQLAQQFSVWQREGRDVALLVGGPDGLAPDCVARAQFVWSLSLLTFPHALVRIMIAEQLYRAWSINNEHPYHRS